MAPTLWQRLAARKRKSANRGTLSCGCLAALLRGLNNLTEICLQPSQPKRAFLPRALAALCAALNVWLRIVIRVANIAT
jgi:hypothetical protein